MELQGFYNEQVLNELLYNEQITQLEYIYHHSQERIDDFKRFCNRNQMEENEDSAEKYAEFLVKVEEQSFTEGLD